MKKVVFVLKWKEPKTSEFLQEVSVFVDTGLVKKIREVSALVGRSIFVKTRAFSEENSVVLDFELPSSFSSKVMNSLFKQAAKELEKQLGCDCTWIEQ